MKYLLAVAALASVLLLCSSTPTEPERSFSTNFSYDLMGPLDNREDTWGRADHYDHKIEFKNVPPGKRVRILRVYGDFVAWVRNLRQPIHRDKMAGVLFGLFTSDPSGNVDASGIQRCDWCAPNTFLYLQDVVGPARPARSGFDFDVKAGGLLAADNVMWVRAASWLNELEEHIHIEPSFTVVYKYE